MAEPGKWQPGLAKVFRVFSTDKQSGKSARQVASNYNGGGIYPSTVVRPDRAFLLVDWRQTGEPVGKDDMQVYAYRIEAFGKSFVVKAKNATDAKNKVISQNFPRQTGSSPVRRSDLRVVETAGPF